jgi:hypothetical protein
MDFEMTAFLREDYGGAVALTARHCPFCGCDSLELEEVEICTWAVCCPSCHAVGPHDAAQDELAALRRWNRSTEAQK